MARAPSLSDKCIQADAASAWQAASAGTRLVLHLLAVPAPLAAVLGFMMSWPQLVTGVLGLLLARLLARRFGWQTGR